jgi:hypothetical protein
MRLLRRRKWDAGRIWRGELATTEGQEEAQGLKPGFLRLRDVAPPHRSGDRCRDAAQRYEGTGLKTRHYAGREGQAFGVRERRESKFKRTER